MSILVDDKLRQSIWLTKIPIKIDMAIEDINDTEKPSSLFFSIPRINYIANIIKDVRKFFDKYLPVSATSEDIWFETNKIPLKWQLPFGVLIDNIYGENFDLPVKVTVRFRLFPEEMLIKYKGAETLKFYTMNSLKEANTIKFGSSKEVLNLGSEESDKLLHTFLDISSNFEEYWKINKKFLDLYLDNIKKFPVKIIMNNTDIMLVKYALVSSENQLSYSLYDFLVESFSETVVNRISDKIKILIHGIELDLRLPMIYLLLNYCYLDNYLYITIR